MINKGPGAGWPTEGTKNSCALDPAPGQGWEAWFSPPWPLVLSLCGPRLLLGLRYQWGHYLGWGTSLLP